MNTPPSKCFHNGIILIVICFQICVDKYTNLKANHNSNYKPGYSVGAVFNMSKIQI